MYTYVNVNPDSVMTVCVMVKIKTDRAVTDQHESRQISLPLPPFLFTLPFISFLLNPKLFHGHFALYFSLHISSLSFFFPFFLSSSNLIFPSNLFFLSCSVLFLPFLLSSLSPPCSHPFSLSLSSLFLL